MTATFLTQEHLDYLRQIEIPPTAVLHARQMRTAEYKAELKNQSKGLAYVAAPCGKGHSLRLRLSSGHCAQCSSVGISSWKKHHTPGFVYIAHSRSLNAFKIGSAQSSIERTDSLNRDGYAGASDWVLRYRRKFAEAGEVETRAHTALSRWRLAIPYIRQGHGTTVKPREVFSCAYSEARDAVEQSADRALSEITEWDR
jgi:hypothetical protein